MLSPGFKSESESESCLRRLGSTGGINDDDHQIAGHQRKIIHGLPKGLSTGKRYSSTGTLD